MFKKILIANRGEIACRIIRTLDRLGIESVAVYSDADRHAAHVRLATEAYHLGPAPAAESYLLGEKIIEVALKSGAEAIHPGYGFLSENAEFAERCETAGLAFIGPTPANMRDFGLKHTARELAIVSEVPVSPGTGLLETAEEALAAAERLGFPVMIKSTAGGGGIGMQLVTSASELAEKFESVQRLARGNFKASGLFLEKYIASARHVEVQIFGDGEGAIAVLGERDCSAQRRNQKVLEETPAPHLSLEVREKLHGAAARLGQAVKYRSAGTCEFMFDADSHEFYFLEVNTRLQVEHCVTEAVTGIDLVEWMVRLAAGEKLALSEHVPRPIGHAIEARIYAEDPRKNFQPSCGLLTEVLFPNDVRVDGWIERGSEVTPYYDPMLAKVIAHGQTREEAVELLKKALEKTVLGGIEANVEYLIAILGSEPFRQGGVTTKYLSGFEFNSRSIDVLEPGTHTTVQDYPGRVGYWEVGVPPSGPMDHLSLRLANRILGNPEGIAALECTVTGPKLRFQHDTCFCITGADMAPTIDGEPVAMWQSHKIRAGQSLKLNGIRGPGCRSYLAIAGGFDVPEYMGSRSTFTLGQFGGHGGRILRSGDVLKSTEPNADLNLFSLHEPPTLTTNWNIGVLYGPHGAPDFFTEEDIRIFFATDWKVHYNSSRTGIRLIGPKPTWARQDGGEAGLHPSNIHDNAYAIGAIDFTGDMPVILAVDGPSLGGFVCPVTIVQFELWKMGQLRPGDTVNFRPMAYADAVAGEEAQDAYVRALSNRPSEILPEATPDCPILEEFSESPNRPRVVYRQAGDRYLLVEYGPLILDLELRFRAHALMESLSSTALEGIIDLTPGIRSLQIHYDSRVLPRPRLLENLIRLEETIPPIENIEVPTRIIRLPLSWDDPATRLAIEKYTQSVRPDAPWCPSNIEFIRRINGLTSIEEVKEIVFSASYLVMGLGDVYLGAPVATPLDPRHRLVTTKYNPARTWTPENAVGIGGAYLCVYGMEGPGGYQFVGRTIQMWNRWKETRDFNEPWLLRHFDQIQFYPVSAEELLQMREDFPEGKLELEIRHETFRFREYREFLAGILESSIAFKARQQAAFEAERGRWASLGSVETPNDFPDEDAPEAGLELPTGAHAVDSHVAANVWSVLVTAGQEVLEGDVLVILEAMKMEIAIVSPSSGRVHSVRCSKGQMVFPGQTLAVIEAG